MKKLALVFLLFLQFVILPQNSFIRQITSGDFDARNPFIYKNEFGYDSKIFFELHKDGYSNIYSVLYNSDQIDFEDTSAITTGTFDNLNPSYEPASGLIFQTNQNGNWDIIYKPVTNNLFGGTVFLTSSSADEFLPKFFESTNMFQDSVNILLRRQNDIVFLSYKNNQIKEDVVFQDSVNLHYSEFVGLETGDWGIYTGHYVYAIEESNLLQKKIVRRFKPANGTWQPKTIVLENCDCLDLSLQVSGYNPWGLFFLDTLQNQRRLFTIEDPIAVTSPQIVDIDYEGNISSFDMYSLLLVGKEFSKPEADPEFYMPYSYLLKNGDSTKIRINKYDIGYWIEDSLVNVSLPEPNLAIGPVGSDLSGMVVYTIWEDSVGGNIHLFGASSHLPYGAVEEESYANDFVLYQNYPNPFNPSTKIEYKLLQASDVKFNVFNILGEKVFEQIFGYQTAGSYKINFDGKNLPSGVYVYSIYTNENRLSRKMLLMK
jgi:hypothetical protein